ncbi:hypothetical protein [Streptomyces sp. NPDC055105]|uniref:hypothetical protein n=1 Tax=Streptomyces sp. NPDC055105 TaxID=3365719 RepID=UPI0037CD761F
MVRNVLGSILALIGATAAVSSPFRAWYDGRHGRYYRLGDLFTGAGVTDARATLFGSLLLPFVVAAAATLIGIVLRSRLLVAFAGVVVLAFTVLWMVRVGQAEGRMVVAGDGSGLGLGVAGAVVGGALLLLGAAVMSGRQKGRPRQPEYADQGYAGDSGPEPTHFTDPVPPPAPTLDGPQHTLEGPMQPYADQPPYPDPPYEEPPYEEGQQGHPGGHPGDKP